jgi:hypothetical protein
MVLCKRHSVAAPVEFLPIGIGDFDEIHVLEHQVQKTPGLIERCPDLLQGSQADRYCQVR